MNVHDKCDQIIWKAVNVLFHKTPARVIYHSFVEKDDAYQQAWIALLEDKKIYDLAQKDAEANGGLIYTVVYRRLQDHIREAIGRVVGGRIPNKMKMLKTEHIEDRPELRTPDVKADAFEKTLLGEVITFLNNKLSTKDLYVARMLFFENKSESEIARKLGITESRVSQIKKKISAKTNHKFAS